MQGPFLLGSHRGVTCLKPGPWEESILIRGNRYRVIKEFKDEKGEVHPIGEEWVFVASLFSPYDNLMLVVVRTWLVVEWEFELDGRPRENVVDHFESHVELVSLGSRLKRWWCTMFGTTT